MLKNSVSPKNYPFRNELKTHKKNKSTNTNNIHPLISQIGNKISHLIKLNEISNTTNEQFKSQIPVKQSFSIESSIDIGQTLNTEQMFERKPYLIEKDRNYSYKRDNNQGNFTRKFKNIEKINKGKENINYLNKNHNENKKSFDIKDNYYIYKEQEFDIKDPEFEKSEFILVKKEDFLKIYQTVKQSQYLWKSIEEFKGEAKSFSQGLKTGNYKFLKQLNEKNQKNNHIKVNRSYDLQSQIKEIRENVTNITKESPEKKKNTDICILF